MASSNMFNASRTKGNENENTSVYLKYSWVVDMLWAVMILAAGYNSFFFNRELFQSDDFSFLFR